MKDFKELEEKINKEIQKTIQIMDYAETGVVGYLKGLETCIELIHAPEQNEKDSCEPEYPMYNVGEAVLYQNGDKFELGIVKSLCGHDEYFIWYHTGDTAARTHARHLHKISNDYAFNIIRLDTDGKERR